MEDEIERDIEENSERELDETVRADRRNKTIGQAIITDVVQHEDGERVSITFKLPDGEETFTQTFVRPRYRVKHELPPLDCLYEEEFESLSDVRHEIFDVHLDANGEWELDAVVEETSSDRLAKRSEESRKNRTAQEERVKNVGGLLGVANVLQAILGSSLLLFALLVSVPLTIVLADPVLTFTTAVFILSLGVGGVVGLVELNRRLQEYLFDRASETPLFPTVYSAESVSIGDKVQFTDLAGTYRVSEVEADSRRITLTDVNDGSFQFDAEAATGLFRTGARTWVSSDSDKTIDLGYCTPAEVGIADKLSSTLDNFLKDV